MAGASKISAKRRARPLYHASKISERRFRAVLRHFARDDTAAETAARIGLSVNAVNTLFMKLRRFFVEVGLFTDFYVTAEQDDPDDERFEHQLLGFHIKRMKARRWMSRGMSASDHFAESHWRFHYAMLLEDRGSDAAHAMMERHLLEAIRLCGPVGRLPVNRKAGLRLTVSQMDERIQWAVRNSQRFRDCSTRTWLTELLNL